MTTVTGIEPRMWNKLAPKIPGPIMSKNRSDPAPTYLSPRDNKNS